MGRAVNQNVLTLTDAKIARLATPGLFAVGGNLYVNVTASGGKQWIFRYRGADGKRHDMGLGSTEVVTLDDARGAALECRRLCAQGGDPLAHRRRMRIAMRLGIEKTAMIRVRAGISYALTEAMDEGHCGLPAEELRPLAVELLEVPEELIQTALDLELAERTVIADTVGEAACIFLAGLYRAEQVIAERILRLAVGKLPWPHIDPEKWSLMQTSPQNTRSRHPARSAVRFGA